MPDARLPAGSVAPVRTEPGPFADRHLRHRRRRRLAGYMAVSAGGVIGSLARYAAELALPTPPGHLPWATFVVNVSGCLLIGVLMVLLLDVWRPGRYARPFLAVGVLGGYTTFSTYALETRDLLSAGRPALAAGYFAGSLAAGLTAVWIGLALTRLAVRPHLAARQHPAAPRRQR